MASFYDPDIHDEFYDDEEFMLNPDMYGPQDEIYAAPRSKMPQAKLPKSREREAGWVDGRGWRKGGHYNKDGSFVTKDGCIIQPKGKNNA